ncbi:MAG TPA: hypothetical protein VN777_15850 [Terriglobales bacterium]|nr:hypothetical protein [Terriglobales bacterium]HZW97211.1 hypothetical protein [Candidatus Eremiobacteraceae bacterium]
MRSKIGLFLVGMFCSPAIADAQLSRRDSFQQLRRDYQFLARDYQALASEIFAKQADYGQLNIKILKEIIEGFIGDLAGENPPFERPPGDPISTGKRYADYIQDLRDEFNVFLNAWNLGQRLDELNLRAENLKVRAIALARDQQRKKTLAAFTTADTKPKDFSELDTAIVEMDKADKVHQDEFAGIKRVIDNCSDGITRMQDVIQMYDCTCQGCDSSGPQIIAACQTDRTLSIKSLADFRSECGTYLRQAWEAYDAAKKKNP